MMLRLLLVGCLSFGCVVAQGSNKEPVSATKTADRGPLDQGPLDQGPLDQGPLQKPAPKFSADARVALAAARKLVKESRKVTGPARSRKLELAAAAFDSLVAQFQKEPAVAAYAAWNAAETWQRHGSAPLAEKDYLYAAKADALRYGQRGLLGAAHMQRRQQRVADAMKTYAKAEAVDPRTSRAQEARLWVARLLLAGKQVDKAIEKFQAALESAPTTRQAIETADYLAKAWIVKGDLESAGFVIDHARTLVQDEKNGDPIVAERLRRAFERMRAHRALQQASDEKFDVAGDAVRLDEHRKRAAKKARGKKRKKSKKTKKAKQAK